MVALEAWALAKPVLANAKCDVLKGQCIRSNGGLYYESDDEFVATLSSLERNRWLSASLGRNGRQFYHEHYDWPVIERKYLDMLERLSKAGVPHDCQRHCRAGWSAGAGIVRQAPRSWRRCLRARRARRSLTSRRAAAGRLRRPRRPGGRTTVDRAGISSGRLISPGRAGRTRTGGR